MLNTTEQLNNEQEMTGTYEDYGFNRAMTKEDAPMFQEEPITFKKAKLGDTMVESASNVGAGTILRGSLATRARAFPFLIMATANPVYQVNTPVSLSAANLIVSLSGNGSPNYMDGWYLYGDFPLKDRSANHNSTYAPTGIAIDDRGVFVGQGTHLYKMPLDFISITEITPSGSALPAINGLASDGKYLYTVNGTTFYKITLNLSNNTYTFTNTTLSFNVSKIGCFDGKLFFGYDETNHLIREWQTNNTLWRSVPCIESNYCGILNLHGYPYFCRFITGLSEIQLIPILI